MDVGAIAAELKLAKREKKQIAEQEKAVNKKIEALERQMAEAMAEQGLDKVHDEDGTSFSRGEKVYASCTKDNREAMVAWMRSNGFGDLVEENVHSTRLRSWVQARIEEGLEVPGMLSVHKRPAVNVRNLHAGE